MYIKKAFRNVGRTFYLCMTIHNETPPHKNNIKWHQKHLMLGNVGSLIYKTNTFCVRNEKN